MKYLLAVLLLTGLSTACFADIIDTGISVNDYSDAGIHRQAVIAYENNWIVTDEVPTICINTDTDEII